MIHDFILLPVATLDRKTQCEGHFQSPNALHLDEDIIHYMSDSLGWIQTSNPANPQDQPGLGLNNYGPTAIEGEGAKKLTKILRAWADLFSCGSQTLELTGEFTWTVGEPSESGAFEELRLDRDSLVKNLLSLADLAAKADGESHWLLHLGI